MKIAIHHTFATLAGAFAGVIFVGYILGIPVWIIVGDNPPLDHPILKIYNLLWYTSPFTGATFFNYLVYKNRRNRRKEAERKNMTTEEILKRAKRV